MIPDRDHEAAVQARQEILIDDERATLAAVDEGSFALMYLNRLSDLLWALARWQDGVSDLAKSSGPASTHIGSPPPKGSS